MAKVFVVAMSCVLGAAVAANAQTCETRPLPYDVNSDSELTPLDCRQANLRDAAGEFWTFDATLGDRIIVLMRRLAMADPYLIIVDSNNLVVATGDDIGADRDARAEFTASKSGVYRAYATSFARWPSTDYGSYTIRLERVTKPTAPNFHTFTVSGNQVTLAWTAPFSAGPILEYILDVGTSAGGLEIGRYHVGLATSVVASAGAGVYYIRVLARNAHGEGVPSVERVITVGGLAPTAPRQLTASVSGRRATLTWLAPTLGDVLRYEIVVGSTPGGSDLGVFDVGTSRQITSGEVAPGAYYARVRAVNAHGTSPASNEVVVLVF